ncbi:MAG: DUF4190 domain-containing protein [Pedosphaera sp.]|nr:DUF4190 domain-containing protein [Pedosphaera sp.]
MLDARGFVPLTGAATRPEVARAGTQTNERRFVYRIIGSDDKEYGPISADQIRQWLREGRLNRTSRIKPENSNDWKVIGALPEFDESFPPLPGAAPAHTGPTKTCGLATGALVCGALGFTCIAAVVGLVLGFLAHARIRRSNGRLTGSGMATAGIVLSLIFILIGIFAIPAAMLLPALSKAKQRAQTIHCVNNAKQLALGVIMYASDNNEVMPTATNWCADIQKYVGGTQAFQCPQGNDSFGSHFAFNVNLNHVAVTNIPNPSATVVLFETDGGWNVSGGREAMLTNSRHGKSFVVAFADGHVEMVLPSRLLQLKWEP